MKKQTDNGGSANSNKKAAALLADASRIMQGVIKYVTNPDEAESFQEIFEAYGKARNNIERILTEYPASDLAAELTSGKTRISDFTLVKFRELENLLKRLAAAGRSQVACILFIADTINDAKEKALALCKIAGEYAESGETQEVLRLLSQAQKIADTIGNSVEKDWTLRDIAKDCASAGEFNRGAGATTDFQGREIERRDRQAGCDRMP